MKNLLAFVLLIPLMGCNALGGIPPETVDAIASAGGGCVAVESLIMGKAIMMVGSADKGSLKNGEVTVQANCGGITIRNDAAPARSSVVKPPPSTASP